MCCDIFTAFSCGQTMWGRIKVIRCPWTELPTLDSSCTISESMLAHLPVSNDSESLRPGRQVFTLLFTKSPTKVGCPYVKELQERLILFLFLFCFCSVCAVHSLCQLGIFHCVACWATVARGKPAVVGSFHPFIALACQISGLK